MDQQQIKAFIDAMAASDLAEMEISHDGWTLRLVRHGGTGQRAAAVASSTAIAAPSASRAAPPALGEGQGGGTAEPAKREEETGAHEVRAPMFGVVHLQQAPGEPPFVKPGDRLEAGQVLCTIEAMKVFNEVRAECAGRVTAVLVASGAEVEADQPLMTIERADHV